MAAIITVQNGKPAREAALAAAALRVFKIMLCALFRL